MTVAEQIVQHLNSLPETAQAEVLDFVVFPESRSTQCKLVRVLSDSGDAGNGIRGKSVFAKRH